MNTKNKTETLKFRVNLEEKNQLKELLKVHNYGSISKFFRTQIDLLKEKPMPQKTKSRDKIIQEATELLSSQISKIGININQFVKKANASHGNSDLLLLGNSILQQQGDIADLIKITIDKFEKFAS